MTSQTQEEKNNIAASNFTENNSFAQYLGGTHIVISEEDDPRIAELDHSRRVFPERNRQRQVPNGPAARIN